MPTDMPEREFIEKAEDLVTRLRDVQTCRISSDGKGSISEIHVVATSDRPAKMIARDVETCLKAELACEIDYRKIGVVLIDPPREAARPQPALVEEDPPPIDLTDVVDDAVDDRFAETGERPFRVVAGDAPAAGQAPEAGDAPRLEFLENDVRPVFEGLTINLGGDRVDVEVRLSRSDLEVVGCLGGPRRGGPDYGTIAGATLHALVELLDEDFDLCLSGIDEVVVAGRQTIFAVVDVVDGRSVRPYAGCAFTGRDPNEAVVLAVLDAVNRPFCRWRPKREIHYTIR
ncbi:MAG: hypothetical protein JW876_00355 [Candidatus Krumholzibacteriota bacterium]|nr:hypothetical protein [Candidatus Krumholzibacteriota bacterium]